MKKIVMVLLVFLGCGGVGGSGVFEAPDGGTDARHADAWGAPGKGRGRLPDGRIGGDVIDTRAVCEVQSESCNAYDDDCDGEIDNSAVCGGDAAHYNGHTYVFSWGRVLAPYLVWEEAQRACARQGYALVAVDSAPEGLWVARWAQQFGATAVWTEKQCTFLFTAKQGDPEEGVTERANCMILGSYVCESQ